MVQFLKRIAEADWFNRFITLVIIVAAVLVGVETYPSMAERYHSFLVISDVAIIWIFVAEAVIKIVAEGRKPQNYFKDPWNIFDFTIVVAAFMPINAQYVVVLRLIRLLRVLRLVRALPKLQVLVGALLKSIPSMAYVGLLLGLLFYVYAVAGTLLFAENDPVHFRNLQMSLLSLFRVVTLEDWTDVMYIQMYGCAEYGYSGIESMCTSSKANPILGASYFVSFVLFGTMVVLNLFIGVILSGMDEAKEETWDIVHSHGDERDNTVAEDLHDLGRQIGDLSDQLAAIQRKLKRSEAAGG